MTRLRVIRLEFNRSLKLKDRRPAISFQFEDLSQIIMGPGVTGIDLHQLPVKADCFFELTPSGHHVDQAGLGFNAFGIRFQGRPVDPDRFPDPPQFGQSVAQGEPGGY